MPSASHQTTKKVGNNLGHWCANTNLNLLPTGLLAGKFWSFTTCLHLSFSYYYHSIRESSACTSPPLCLELLDAVIVLQDAISTLQEAVCGQANTTQ